jgi:hypothetical protein
MGRIRIETTEPFGIVEFRVPDALARDATRMLTDRGALVDVRADVAEPPAPAPIAARPAATQFEAEAVPQGQPLPLDIQIVEMELAPFADPFSPRSKRPRPPFGPPASPGPPPPTTPSSDEGSKGAEPQEGLIVMDEEERREGTTSGSQSAKKGAGVPAVPENRGAVRRNIVKLAAVVLTCVAIYVFLGPVVDRSPRAAWMFIAGYGIFMFAVMVASARRGTANRSPDKALPR